jgi:hypothetical protein
MKYYVYAYLDSKLEKKISFNDIIFTHIPIYIGKGKNNRMFEHFKDRKRFNTYFYNKLNKMILEDNKPIVVKLKEFDNEEDAIKLEVNLISFLGKKKNGGLLYNLTDGGDGISGYRHSDKTKQLLRLINIENNSYLRFPDNKGENHNLYGKKHKQSSIDKMIDNKKGTKQSPEWIENRVSKLRGVPLSKEHKYKISESNKGKITSDETRKKQSLSRLGKSPYNKGKIRDIILQIDIDGNIIKEWYNLCDLESDGFQKSNVINVCNGKRKSHRGFIWKYKCNYSLNILQIKSSLSGI